MVDIDREKFRSQKQMDSKNKICWFEGVKPHNSIFHVLKLYERLLAVTPQFNICRRAKEEHSLVMVDFPSQKKFRGLRAFMHEILVEPWAVRGDGQGRN